MSTRELIIERLKNIQSDTVLRSILNLISAESNAQGVYKVNHLEEANIKEGLADADNGNVYNQEEANAIIEKWFREKSDGLRDL